MKKLFIMTMMIIMAGLFPTLMWADNVTKEQFDAAYAAITDKSNQDAEGDYWFRIYTYSIGDSKSESTKYYLTTSGTLTSSEAEAGSFQFVQVSSNVTGFSCYYSEDQDQAFHIKNGSNYFTNANRTAGNNIRTSTNNRGTYEAQVFFRNEDGKYAVRSTNANGVIGGGWWEASWWTVSSEGVACYTEPDEMNELGDIVTCNANFIWELEKAEAGDIVHMDTSVNYHLSFEGIKSGSTYKYLLSNSYYTEYGYEDVLLHRTNVRGKQMEVQLTEVENVKNGYYIKDVQGEYYICPSADDANGTAWTLSTEPAVVILSITGTENTYTLSGTAGGKANPWGNDTAPYTVANYNGSNNVLFSAVGETQVESYGEFIEPAYNAIKSVTNEAGEMWYRIYTYSENGSSLGNTKYYMTSNGTLSTKVADASSFNFVSVPESTSGLTEKAFFVKNGSSCFTNANKAEGTNIRTSTNGRDTYDAQIFCMKDGKYAVRSTNAEAGSWWENSWWTVKEAGVTCYTQPDDANAAYIWELESVEAVDDAIKFAEGKYYSVTLNKSINYKYLKSPAYNEEGDNVLRRTTDEEQIFTATMVAVEGIKNGFTVQDKKSGLYIAPATDNNNGTNWTVSQTAQTVIFTEVSAGVYTMTGEAGGNANAYGDDGETNGFRVANYGSPSQWIFTRLTDDDEVVDEDLEGQMADAVTEIGERDDLYYKIYTTSLDGGQTFGDTKYYLTAAGTLTDNEDEAGTFLFSPVGEGMGGYCDYAYQLKNGANYFTNANKTTGANIRTSTYNRKTYEAQVFLYGENEKYAVRSTNAFEGSYWENSWWTAVNSADDGIIACYTEPADENRVYIWELEKSVANDIIHFQAEGGYTITYNKESVEHKFLQSQKYNEEGDLVLRRTNDGNQAIKVSMTEADGVKNGFYIQDMESGYYITPATDAVNGTDWTFNHEPSVVIFEQISEGIYTMAGENGSKANAYGDDNEKESYRVAHYGTASQWTIVAAGSENDPVGIKDVDNSQSTVDGHFTLTGLRIHTLQSGINIVKKNGKTIKVYIK